MTKVTILGKSQGEEPKKKIEFVKFLDIDSTFSEIKRGQEPIMWDNVLLLNKDFTTDGLDLIYAYNNDGFGRILVLGHFNDGVV